MPANYRFSPRGPERHGEREGGWIRTGEVRTRLRRVRAPELLAVARFAYELVRRTAGLHRFPGTETVRELLFRKAEGKRKLGQVDIGLDFNCLSYAFNILVNMQTKLI